MCLSDTAITCTCVLSVSITQRVVACSTFFCKVIIMTTSCADHYDQPGLHKLCQPASLAVRKLRKLCRSL